MKATTSKMIFITGASRSGTTMLNDIFGKHTNVLGLNELHAFGDLIQSNALGKTLSEAEQTKLATTILKRQKYNIWKADQPLNDNCLLTKVMDKLTATDGTAADVFRVCVMECGAVEGKEWVSEQTPRNIFFASDLLNAYPEAQIVHIVRNPKSVLASQKSKWRQRFLGANKIPMMVVVRTWCNYHPITLSKLWVKANMKAIQHESHERFHMIRFEDILDNPEDAISSLCDKVGIEFEPTMLKIKHEGSSHQQVKTGVTGISKATTESWRKSLSSSDVLVSEKMTEELMQRFGYEKTKDNKLSIVSVLLMLIRFPIHILGVFIFNFQRALVQLKSVFNKG